MLGVVCVPDLLLGGLESSLRVLKINHTKSYLVLPGKLLALVVIHLLLVEDLEHDIGLFHDSLVAELQDLGEGVLGSGEGALDNGDPLLGRQPVSVCVVLEPLVFTPGCLLFL